MIIEGKEATATALQNRNMNDLPETQSPQYSEVVSVLPLMRQDPETVNDLGGIQANEPTTLNSLDPQQKISPEFLPHLSGPDPVLVALLNSFNDLSPHQETTTNCFPGQQLALSHVTPQALIQGHTYSATGNSQTQVQSQRQHAQATPSISQHDPVQRLELQDQGQRSVAAAETCQHDPVLTQDLQNQTQVQTQTPESLTTAAGTFRYDSVPTQSNSNPDWINKNCLYKKLEDYMNPDNERLPLQSAQLQVTFTILEQMKTKKRERTTYMVYKNLVTIKPETPLPIRLSGAKANQEVEVSLRRKDLDRQREPVVNPKSRNGEENPTKCESAFDVTSHGCRYERVDGHPTAIFPVQYKTWEENPTEMDFALKFLYFNSELKGQGKSQGNRLELVLCLVEKSEAGRSVVKEQRFFLEIRGNIDRDHLEAIKHLFPQEFQADQGLACKEAKLPTIKLEPKEGRRQTMSTATPSATYEATLGGEAMTDTTSGQIAVEYEATRDAVRKRRVDSKYNVGEGSETVDPSPKRARIQEPAQPTAAPGRDEWTVFGESVTLRLRAMKDNKKRRAARHRIEAVLYDLEDE